MHRYVLRIWISIHLGIAIKGPHKATHGQGKAASQHHHRGQQTLRQEVTQALGAVRSNYIKVDEIVLKLRDGSVEDLSLERVAALLAAQQEGACII